jgi:hypothetical protein
MKLGGGWTKNQEKMEETGPGRRKETRRKWEKRKVGVRWG